MKTHNFLTSTPFPFHPKFYLFLSTWWKFFEMNPDPLQTSQIPPLWSSTIEGQYSKWIPENLVWFCFFNLPTDPEHCPHSIVLMTNPPREKMTLPKHIKTLIQTLWGQVGARKSGSELVKSHLRASPASQCCLPSSATGISLLVSWGFLLPPLCIHGLWAMGSQSLGTQPVEGVKWFHRLSITMLWD